jgi:hypothetical protein
MPVTAEAPLVMDDSFERSLDGLSQDLPEIAEKRELILQGGQELIDEWQIKPEFFDDRSRAVFFAAIAERNATVNTSGNTSNTAYKEKEFIANVTTMLAAPYSEYSEELQRAINPEDTYKDEVIDALYDKFTNKEVTAELQTALDDNLLHNVRQRLGVTDENEDPYTLRVINVGQDSTMYGMRPSLPANHFSLKSDDPLMQAYWEDMASFKLYEKGIQRNTEEFLGSTGKDTIPVAWVTHGDNGEAALNLPLPTAEKLLHADEILLDDNEFSNKDYVAEAQATLEHEYAHTQGGLFVNGLSFGIMAEERRAELMSGDKMGYQDAKGLIDVDMAALTGVLAAEYMKAHEKGGNPEEFYPLIAKKLGMQSALEFALVVPDAYMSDRRPLQKQVNEYLGGINGFEERLYKANPDWVDERIDRWAEGSYKRQSVGQWLAMRKNMNGLGFVTDKMRDALTRKRAEHNWAP